MLLLFFSSPFFYFFFNLLLICLKNSFLLKKDLILGKNVDKKLYQTLKNLIIINDNGKENGIMEIYKFYRKSHTIERKKRKSAEAIHKLVVEQNNERVNRLEQEVIRLKNEKEAHSIETKPVPKDCLLAQRENFQTKISKLKNIIESFETEKNAVLNDKRAILAKNSLQKRVIDGLSSDISAIKQAEQRIKTIAENQLLELKRQQIKNSELVKGYSHLMADLSRLETLTKVDAEAGREIDMFFEAEAARMAAENKLLARNKVVAVRGRCSALAQNVRYIKSQVEVMKRVLKSKIDSADKNTVFEKMSLCFFKASILMNFIKNIREKYFCFYKKINSILFY